VGGGLDAPGPARNGALARRVARTGVVLSEVPPGVAAQAWRFPVRNRILAGLADVVVVVESGAGGGSMITVREAQRRDRPVLAVPGPVDSPASDGTNQLVSEGATVCRDADDVLCALGLEGAVPRSPAPPDQRPLPAGPAAAVLEQLGWRPASLDQLAGACGLGLAELSGALRWLEDHAWVESRGGFVERVARATIRAPDGRRP
jgi:DNA processing protein